MPTVIGYLRKYRRWNGEPGLSIEDQRRMIWAIAKRLRYEGRSVEFQYKTARYPSEVIPVLERLVRAACMAESQDLAIVPTLDGVRLNVCFLRALNAARHMAVTLGEEKPAIYIQADRPLRIAYQNAAGRRRVKQQDYWLLTDDDDAHDLSEMVRRVWARGAKLRSSVSRSYRTGRRTASSQRHLFTKKDRAKGGRKTAQARRERTEGAYSHDLVSRVVRWRVTKRLTLGQIVDNLHKEGVRAPQGGPIGRMHVYRILKRSCESHK